MRIIAILCAALLGGCQAAAQTATASVHGNAYVDVQRVLHADPLARALSIEDRQIASLERTIASAPAMPVSPQRAGVRGAQAAIAGLASSSARYARSQRAGEGPSAIPDQIARGYAAQVARVHMRAQASQEAYASELAAQESAQAQGLANALNRRVAQAYGLRAQSLEERESDAAVARDEAVSGRQAALRAKAAAAVPSKRASLERQLNAIARRLSAQAAAERQRDSVTLARYAATLRSQASADYAAARTRSAHSAEENVKLRSHVTSAQLAAPNALAMPFAVRPFSTEMRRRADALKRYETAGFSHDASETRSSLGEAQRDLSARFESLSHEQHAARTSALQELARLRASRSALYGELIASIVRQARAIAAQRGLALGRRAPSATDLTPAVIEALKKRFNV